MNLKKLDDGWTQGIGTIWESQTMDAQLTKPNRFVILSSRQWMSIRWLVTWESWKNKTMDKDCTNGG